MYDMQIIPLSNVLSQKDTRGTGPKYALYEIFERHGKSLPHNAYGFGHQGVLYDLSPAQDLEARAMLDRGTLVRQAGTLRYFDAGVRQLALSQA